MIWLGEVRGNVESRTSGIKKSPVGDRKRGKDQVRKRLNHGGGETGNPPFG